MFVSVFAVIALAASSLATPFVKAGKRNGHLGNPTIEELTIISEIDYYENGQFVSKSLTTEVVEKTIWDIGQPVPTSSLSPPSEPTSSNCASDKTTSPKGATATVPIQSQPTSQSPPASQSAAPTSSVSPTTSTPDASSAPDTSSTAPTSSPPVVSSASPTSSLTSAQPSSAASSDALATGWVDMNNDTQKFADIAVYHHNVHRFNHSAPAMFWNETLFDVPGSSGTGMNIAMGTYSSPADLPNLSAMISGMWYNSEFLNFPQYGVNDLNVNDKSFDGWGHFSQVVWPSSVQLGCGMTDCGGFWFGACLYSPPGNIIGHFADIGSPEGHPIVYPNGEQH
ncbi:MAG: hypothetical protein MMC23_006123 [Stictis urceolatum]|nr:hypothetical protein [Stictis urceolata]